MGHEQAFPRERLFERLARDAQSAKTLAEFRLELLRGLRRELGVDSAAIFDPPGPPGDPKVEHEGSAGIAIVPELQARYFRERSRYDRSIAPMLFALRTRGVVIDDELYGAREKERLELYAEVLLPQGARSILSAIISFRGRPSSLVTLKRHGGGARFRPRDAEKMAELLPALGLADVGFRSSLETAKAPRPLEQWLTPREAQVARLACAGMSNVEIARSLGSSRETVKKQLSRVFEKAGVSNRTELAARFATR